MFVVWRHYVLGNLLHRNRWLVQSKLMNITLGVRQFASTCFSPSPKDNRLSLLYKWRYSWSDGLVTASSGTGGMWTHVCLPAKLSSFQQAMLPPHLRQSFHFTPSLPRQKRGRKTSQFFTFMRYESCSIFLCSISSPFLMNLSQRHYKLNFDFFQLPPPPTEDPFFWFLQPHPGLGRSHFSDPPPMTHYRECGPLGSGMIIMKMEGGMSHVPHTWFYCFVWLTFFDDQQSHRPAELTRGEKSWKKSMTGLK